eukprot:SAG11_NODE_2175_length_3718_cov_3.873169_3_plen_596_part_00
MLRLPLVLVVVLQLPAVAPAVSPTTSPAAHRRSTWLWFWGCDDDRPPARPRGHGAVDVFFSQLAPVVFSQPAAPDFVTGLIPACGYDLGDALPAKGQPLAPLDRRGGFSLPCCSELHGLLSVVNRSRARGMQVFPLLTGYTDSGPAELRAFLANTSLVKRYIVTMVREAVVHDFDGFSFDWEYRGWNARDAHANAQFVLQFAGPLAAANKSLSVAIDNASHPNLELKMLRGHPGISIITMSSYTSNASRFEEVVGTAAATGLPYSAGLSCAHETPGYGVHTSAEVEERFEYLRRRGVDSVSLFGEWQFTNDTRTLLEVFAQPMRRFLRGHKSDDDKSRQCRRSAGIADASEPVSLSSPPLVWDSIVRSFDDIRDQPHKGASMRAVGWRPPSLPEDTHRLTILSAAIGISNSPDHKTSGPVVQLPAHGITGVVLSTGSAKTGLSSAAAAPSSWSHLTALAGERTQVFARGSTTPTIWGSDSSSVSGGANDTLPLSWFRTTFQMPADMVASAAAGNASILLELAGMATGHFYLNGLDLGWYYPAAPGAASAGLGGIYLGARRRAGWVQRSRLLCASFCRRWHQFRERRTSSPNSVLR